MKNVLSNKQNQLQQMQQQQDLMNKMNRNHTQPHQRNNYHTVDPVQLMEQKPLYKDAFRTDQINHQFQKESILHENEYTFKSVIHGLDLNRIKEYPLDNREAYELPEHFRRDPYLIACKQYEDGKMIQKA